MAIIVSLIAWRRRPLDDDNNVGSLKPLRDAIAQSLGVEHSVSETVRQGLELALAQARELGPDSAVVVAGSIYVAGEAVQALG